MHILIIFFYLISIKNVTKICIIVQREEPFLSKFFCCSCVVQYCSNVLWIGARRHNNRRIENLQVHFHRQQTQSQCRMLIGLRNDEKKVFARCRRHIFVAINCKFTRGKFPST